MEGALRDRHSALVRVLPEHEVDDGLVPCLICPLSNALTAKVRVLIDFLVERIGEPSPRNRS